MLSSRLVSIYQCQMEEQKCGGCACDAVGGRELRRNKAAAREWLGSEEREEKE